MNTQQITRVLQSDRTTRPYFRGVFPSDKLPESIQRFPAAFVANVDPEGKPGSHWCAFYFNNEQDGEFFDSYGLKPGDYNSYFQAFLNKHSKKWSYNQRRLQDFDSNVCGHYCLYYLTYRCRNVSMKTIVDHFSARNFRQNDTYVYYFITKHFGSIYHKTKKYVNHQISRKK